MSHRAGVVVEQVDDQARVRQVMHEGWGDVIHTVNHQECSGRVTVGPAAQTYTHIHTNTQLAGAFCNHRHNAMKVRRNQEPKLRTQSHVLCELVIVSLPSFQVAQNLLGDFLRPALAAARHRVADCGVFVQRHKHRRKLRAQKTQTDPNSAI